MALGGVLFRDEHGLVGDASTPTRAATIAPCRRSRRVRPTLASTSRTPATGGESYSGHPVVRRRGRDRYGREDEPTREVVRGRTAFLPRCHALSRRAGRYP